MQLAPAENKCALLASFLLISNFGSIALEIISNYSTLNINKEYNKW